MLPLLRFTLDLFASEKVPQDPASPAPVSAGPKLSGLPVQTSQVSTDAAPEQAPWRHPQANRVIELGPHTVAYAFSLARRRSIGLRVGLEGLSVRAPRWVSRSAVETALRERAAWIVGKLHESSARLQQQVKARLQFCDGMQLPYLGGQVQLVCKPDAQAAKWHWRASDGSWQLWLNLPAATDAQRLQAVTQSAFQQQAQTLFEARLQHYAPQVGVRWQRLALSQARTRWGSANSSGVIRLNWRLLHLPLPVLDYVVVHELCHLRAMNHSPVFWAAVAAVLPDYKQLRAALKDDALPVWPSA